VIPLIVTAYTDVHRFLPSRPFLVFLRSFFGTAMAVSTAIGFGFIVVGDPIIE
jgi:hypothetical protein